jgi:hypothetical protein
MFWMRTYPLRGEVGGGWPLEFSSFLGPVKWERADMRVPFGAVSNQLTDRVEGTFVIQLGRAWNMFANVVEQWWFLLTFDEPFLLAFRFSSGYLGIFNPGPTLATLVRVCLRGSSGPPCMTYCTVCNDQVLILDLPSKNVVFGIFVAHRIFKSVSHCPDSLPIWLWPTKAITKGAIFTTLV